MQYFYIVVYTIVGDDLTMCKVGLNPRQLTKWGRREATLEQGVRENCLVNQETIKFILMRLDEIPSNSCTLLGIYEYKFNTLTI